MHIKKIKSFKLLDIARFLLLTFPISLFLGNAVVEIVMCTIGILFIINSAKTKHFEWVKTDWVKASILFWAYICTRSLWAESPQISLERGLPFIRYIVFASAIAFWILRDDLIKKYLISSLVCTVIFFGTSAIMQYHLGYDFFGTSYVDLGSYKRLTTTSGKMSIGISLLFIFFPAAAYLITHNKHLALIYLLIGAFAILLSGERMALLLLSLGLLLLVFNYKKLKVYFLYFILVLSIFVSGLIMTKSEVIQRQIISTKTEITSFSQTSYGKIYQISTDLFLVQPIFGVGLRHFQTACLSDQYQPAWLNLSSTKKEYLCTNHPHNIFLEVAVETGLVGLGLFLLIIGCWIRYIYNNYKDIVHDRIKTGAVINIILKLIPIAAASSLFIAWPTAPLWFMVGILYSKNKK